MEEDPNDRLELAKQILQACLERFQEIGPPYSSASLERKIERFLLGVSREDMSSMEEVDRAKVEESRKKWMYDLIILSSTEKIKRILLEEFDGVHLTESNLESMKERIRPEIEDMQRRLAKATGKPFCECSTEVSEVSPHGEVKLKLSICRRHQELLEDFG